MPFFEIPSRVTFKRQIILAFVVGFFFLIAGFATYLVTTERDNLHRDSVNEATSMAQSLAASALPWVLANDVAGLQETVNAFHAYPEFSYAMVISPTGKVLAHSDPTKVGLYVTDEQSLALLKTTHDSRVMADNESTIDVAASIETNKRQVGWARVGASKKENTNNLRKMIWNNTVFLLLATAFSFIAAMLIANRLGRRIGSLVQVADNVQAGNFDTRVSISSGGDEISTLGNSLNKMLDALSQNEIELRKASLYTRSLIEASVDPLVTISADGKITDVNEATEKVTGKSRTELIGTDFSNYFTEPDKAREGYQQVFAKGFVTDYPLALRHRDGHITDVLYNASVYRGEAGKVLGVFAAARDVTERNKAEAALRESEALQQTTMKILPVGLWVFGADGNIIFSNDAARQLWAGVRYVGIEQLGEYKGWRVDSGKLVGPHEWAGARALEKGETTIGEEIEIECFDGTHKIILDSAVPLRNSDGSIRGALTINQDITERKQAEDALRENEHFLDSLIENLPIMLFVKDAKDLKFVRFNKAGEGLLGYTRDELIGKNDYDLFPKEQADFFISKDRAIIARREMLDIADEPISTRLLGQRDLHTKKIPIFADDGSPLYLLGISEDITERKKAELEREQYFNFFNTTTDLMGIADPNGAFKKINPAFVKALGYSEAEILAKPFIEFIHPDDRQATLDEMARQLQRGYSLNFENRYRCKDGSFRWLSWKANVNFEEGLTYATARDITERKQAEETLRHSESSLAEAQRMAHLGNWDLDLVNNVLTWSDEIYRIFEIDPEKFGASYEAFLNAIHPEDRAAVDFAYTNSLKTKTPYSIDHRLLFPDGRIKYVQEQCKTFYDKDDKPLHSTGTVHDITERKLAEEEVHQLNAELEQRVIARTAQLEAANKELEAFSYSVSHDLRTPLRAIDGFSHILLEDYAATLDEEGKRLLNVVRENTNKMGQLIDDILKFSRAGRLEMTFSEIDMERMAREVFEELRPSAAEHELQMEIGPLPFSRGDRAMMRQVFVNLISNAIKFTRTREPARIKVGATAEGNEVIYFVQDNGAGFDMRYVDRLFGVFQRLHSESEFEGSGIGLAIVKRIINRHGGRVWAEGKVNEGATIYFTLPT